MGSRSNLCCWEIMQCDKAKKCPARENPQKPCWEAVAQKDDDYRYFFNVCRDCIVHVLKSGSSVLTLKEINTIMKKKTGSMVSSNRLRLVAQKTDSQTTSPGLNVD